MLDFLSFKQHRHTINGVEISSRIGGEGQAIVLLHGYPQNNLMWRKVAPKLAEPNNRTDRQWKPAPVATG